MTSELSFHIKFFQEIPLKQDLHDISKKMISYQIEMNVFLDSCNSNPDFLCYVTWATSHSKCVSQYESSTIRTYIFGQI